MTRLGCRPNLGDVMVRSTRMTRVPVTTGDPPAAAVGVGAHPEPPAQGPQGPRRRGDREHLREPSGSGAACPAGSWTPHPPVATRSQGTCLGLAGERLPRGGALSRNVGPASGDRNRRGPLGPPSPAPPAAPGPDLLLQRCWRPGHGWLRSVPSWQRQESRACWGDGDGSGRCGSGVCVGAAVPGGS